MTKTIAGCGEGRSPFPKCPFCGKKLVIRMVRVFVEGKKVPSNEEYFCYCKEWRESGFRMTRG